MTEIPLEEYLLNMPYVIIFEIFRNLPKSILLGISKCSSKFGDVAKDTRLWKDVYIRYGPTRESASKNTFAFEELYSGPFAVKVIDLWCTKIQPPVSFKTDQVVKVKKLELSLVTANKVTLEAVLAKYQCTKLHLNHIYVKPHGHIVELAPEAFSKQTALEELSLRGTQLRRFNNMETRTVVLRDFFKWLTTVLSKYCKNLKTLDLSYTDLTGHDLACVKSLPTLLEKLYLFRITCPGNSFFELLAEHRPNLKEIGLSVERVKCPALLTFKSLEALHINPFDHQDIRDLYKYLIVFPALKNVYVDIDRHHSSEINLEALRTKLKPHGISVVRITEDFAYPTDGNLWLVSKDM